MPEFVEEFRRFTCNLGPIDEIDERLEIALSDRRIINDVNVWLRIALPGVEK